MRMRITPFRREQELHIRGDESILSLYEDENYTFMRVEELHIRGDESILFLYEDENYTFQARTGTTYKRG
jgi:hypothetical protein